MDRHISADQSRADCFFSLVMRDFMALYSMPLIHLLKLYMRKTNTARKLHRPDETEAASKTINF